MVLPRSGPTTRSGGKARGNDGHTAGRTAGKPKRGVGRASVTQRDQTGTRQTSSTASRSLSVASSRTSSQASPSGNTSTLSVKKAGDAQKKQAQAVKEANEEESRKLHDQMLEEEAGVDDEEQPTDKVIKRKTPANDNDNDEEEKGDSGGNAEALGLLNAPNQRKRIRPDTPEIAMNEDEDEEEGHGPHDHEVHDDMFMEDDEDEEEDIGNQGGLLESQFSNKSLAIVASKSDSGKKHNNGDGDGTYSSKVREQDFSDLILPIAKKCKAWFRQDAAFGTAFPPRDVSEREAFTYDHLINGAYSGHDGTEEGEEHERIIRNLSENDPQMYVRLATFAVYGKRALLWGLMSKAQPLVEAHFNIPAKLTQEEIRSRVAWLTGKGVFRYGSIDLEREYNRQAPFATPLVSSIVRAVWFDGTKGDRPAYYKIMEDKMIRKEMIALCFTVIECALKCWQGGSFTRVQFSEDNCSARYCFFLDTIRELQSLVPEYILKLQKENFELAVKQTKNAALLYTDVDIKKDIEGIDIEMLKATVDNDLIA